MTGKLSPFEVVRINLEHDIDEQYQYQPGEIIRGKIAVQLHRSTVIKSIYITIHGESVCSWEDDWSPYQSSENYIDATQIVYDSSRGSNFLEAGFHTFPFSYELPENIPSSFIGKFGSITYILKATVQGERTGDNTIATEPFLVMRCLELPEVSYKPYEKQVSKTYVAMCSWGKVKARIKLDRTGFVPGDDMYIDAEVQNRSPLRVTAIQGALLMNSVYHAQKNSIPFRQIVNKRRDDYELTPGDGRRWQNVRLGIPAYIPESDLKCCDIIELSYMFQFRLELSSGKEIKIEIPLTIGAKPHGLEVPAVKSDDVNIHWTMGPRDLAKQQQIQKMKERESWQVAAPEFRDEMEVRNPLFRNESQKNGDAKHYKKKGNKHDHHDQFDDISLDGHHESMNNTKL